MLAVNRRCTFSLAILTKFVKPPNLIHRRIPCIQYLQQHRTHLHHSSITLVHLINFLCTYVSTTNNDPHNLGIQLHKKCNKTSARDYKADKNQSKNYLVHHSTIQPIPAVQFTIYTLSNSTLFIMHISATVHVSLNVITSNPHYFIY